MRRYSPQEQRKNGGDSIRQHGVQGQVLAIILEEQLTLSLEGLHGYRTFFIVVGHVVNASAHGIRTHDRSTAGFQLFGNQIHILDARIEPQIVRIDFKDDWHTIEDNSGQGVWRRCQNRAGLHCVAIGVLPAIPNPRETEQLASVDFKTVWRLRFPDPLPFVEQVSGNQTPATFECIPERRLGGQFRILH